MDQKKVVVPKGMLEAFHKAEGDHGLKWYDDVLVEMLEAALRWQSENPIVPNDEQMGSIVNSGIDTYGQVGWEGKLEWDRTLWLIAEWQRRMFFAPEPAEQSFETPFGRFVVDTRVPPGEIRLHNWNGPTWIRNIEPEVPKFMECDTCRLKPGSPTLCAGCLHNREVIEDYRREQRAK